MGYGLIAILVFRTLGSLDSLPADFHDDSWVAAELWFKTHPASHLRVELNTPLGPLPFVLTVSHDGRSSPDGPDEDGWNANKAAPYFPATMRVGADTIPYRFHVQGGGYGGPSQAWLRDEDGSLVLAGYGSGSCTTPSILPRQFLLYGNWKTLDLSAVQVASADERFAPVEAHDTPGTPELFEGRWTVSADGSAIGVLDLRETSGALIVGEAGDPGGDVMPCEGRIDGDLLRLSSFDGERARLVHARMCEDGTIQGEWWDADRGLVSWTAVREKSSRGPSGP